MIRVLVVVLLLVYFLFLQEIFFFSLLFFIYFVFDAEYSCALGDWHSLIISLSRIIYN